MAGFKGFAPRADKLIVNQLSKWVWVSLLLVFSGAVVADESADVFPETKSGTQMDATPTTPSGPGGNFYDYSGSNGGNAFLDAGENRSYQGNPFLEETGSSGENSESGNSFLNEPETLSSGDNYTKELDQLQAESQSSNLFLGQDMENEEGTLEFSSEYLRIADKYWGNKTR
jgi:hypothetical protein